MQIKLFAYAFVYHYLRSHLEDGLSLILLNIVVDTYPFKYNEKLSYPIFSSGSDL